MALRAGYYGVKRWLWDKLQSIPDKVDGLIESNDITGAKNFINNKGIAAKSGATLTYTETGFTSVVSSASWSGAEYNRRCNAKTDFILDLDTDITSGVTYVAVQGSSNDTSYTNIKTSAVLTADGHIRIPFNTGDYTYLKIIFYTTNATATSCDVTISNIQLYLASEPDKSYTPYAMTNQELTKLATTLKYEVLYVDEPATVNTNKDISLDPLLGGKTYFVVAALFQHATNDGYYSLLASEGTATIAYNNTLRLNVASSNFIGKKAKVLIAYSNETFVVDNRDAAPDERSLDVEVEEPAVVKKTTRKKTTKTEEEE